MTIFSVFPVLKKEMALSDVALALLGSTFLLGLRPLLARGRLSWGSFLSEASHPLKLADF